MSNTHNPSDIAFASADQMLAAKGRSFHWARRMLGDVHARRATRLYGFCRGIDDLADEAASPELARTRLDRVTIDIRSGKSSDPGISDALLLMQECNVDPNIALELIFGVMGDLDPVRLDTEAELLRYCYRVAGTVGLMMSAALDVTDDAALPHAIDLGIGMQLTNICRDVSEDAFNNRRYLPSKLVGSLEPEQIQNPDAKTQMKVREGISRLLALADIYYKSGEAGLAYLPARARAGILVASRVYCGIGVKLRSKNFDYLSERTVVSPLGKLTLTAGALFNIPLMADYWAPRKQHQAGLHAALSGLPKVNTNTSVDGHSAGGSHGA